MKKLLFFITAFVISVTTSWAQEIPEGYVSLYTLDYTHNKGEAGEYTESLANYVSRPPMSGNLAIQLLGPGADWSLAKNYCDVSGYDEVRIDLAFAPEDAGNQFAVRYARFGEVAYELIIVPESLTYEFSLDLIPNSEGENHLSALVIAGEHFSYQLTAPPVSQPVQVNYVALREKIEGISVTGISLEEDFTLKTGKTKTLNYTIFPSNASNKVVSWTSSNEEVATVDKIGRITPLSEGTTTITVTTADGDFSDECVVTVIPLIPEGYVSLYTLDYTHNKGEAGEYTESLANYASRPPTSGNLAIQLLGPGADWNLAKNYCDVSGYDEVRIDLAFAPEDAGNQFAVRYARFGEVAYELIIVPESLTYEFSLDLIPNSEGENHLSALVIAGEHFSYQLTAPVVSKPVEVDCVILKPKTEGISVTGISLEEDFTLKLGETKTLNYTILPTNASNKVVSWVSSNEEVATVDETGKITPVVEGTTTITVTTEDGDFSDECVVTVIPLIPEGYVSLYTLDYTHNKGEAGEYTESLANYASRPPMSGNLAIQLLGPGADWSLAKNYCDVSGYDEVRIDLAFAPEDAGNQFAVRYARFGEVAYELIIVPESLTYEFSLDLIPNSEGENHLSALVIAGEHFSYQLTAPPVSQPVQVNYVALREKIEGISVTGISLEEDFTLKTGKTKTLNYTIFPSNASNKVVSWTSSNEEVATVDKIGRITPLSEGTTTITVTTADGDFSDECVVTVIPLIPEGYVSLYTLDYTHNKGEAGEYTESLANYASRPPMSGNLAIQLLGPGADWNLAKNYCDVSGYDEVRIDLAFAPEDAGNQFAVRYARFGEVAYELIIVPESLTYEFSLDLIPNSEGENHLSALVIAGEHFSYQLTAPVVSKPVEVDCVILKVKDEVGIETSTLTEDPNRLVDVYNVAGLLIRKNVKFSEATIGLSKGIYIVGNKKVVVSK